MGKTWLTRWAVALAVVFGASSVHGCQANDAPVDTAGNGRVAVHGTAGQSCGPGHPGCPCDIEGAGTSCGATSGQHGDYVTCAMGRSVCEAGQWGACVTDTLVNKSVKGRAMGQGGLHALRTTTSCPSASPLCDDPCDPNAFTITQSDAGDVDASGTVAGEAGLTLAAACGSLASQMAPCPNGSPTTLTGRVYDPAGVNPLYNAYVYVPLDSCSSLPAFSPGASCDSCQGAGQMGALAITQTAADGSFVLTNVPSTDVAPGLPVPLIVQMGKWRRRVMLTSVPMCTTVPVDPSNSRLPRNRFDGFGGQADIPKIAIATGGQDPIQCLLLKMGLDEAEFQLPGTGTRRIDYYVDHAGGGMDFSPAMKAPDKSALVGSPSTLMSYDLVILPCGGRPASDPSGGFPVDDEYADNVSAYANAGGRLFATHYGITWLATPSNGVVNGASRLVASPNNPATGHPNPFFGIASWNLDAHSYTSVTADIDTTLPGNQAFPEGQDFATWMRNVGASSTPGQLPVVVARHDVDRVNAPAAQRIHNESSPGEPFYFSFDTPLTSGGDAGAGTCGRVGFADFHVSSAALADPSGMCSSDADCGFTAQCNPGVVGRCESPCATTDDCGGNGYACVGATYSTCSAQPCTDDRDCDSNVCNAGTCGCTGPQQCRSGVCTSGVCTHSPQACAEDEQCGSVEVCKGAAVGTCQKACTRDADCSGEICVAGLCQGCFDETDCVSHQCNGGVPSTCSASSSLFPLGCAQAGLAPQEDALEFMLLDLTACVSQSGTATTASVAYDPATFTEDFASACPVGTRPVWRELDWQASIPPSASIVFSAQSTDQPPDGSAPDYSSATLVVLATATTSTTLPGFDVALIDTGTTGAFNLARLPVLSRSNLRLTVTMNPTSDARTAPKLIQWQVKADCLPAE